VASELTAVVYNRVDFAPWYRRLVADLFDGCVVGILIVPLFLISLKWGVVGSLLLALAYEVLALRLFGRTLGQTAVEIRVVSVTGERLSFAQCGVRHLSKYISAGGLMVGYVAALWNPRVQTWHDKLSGCYVVLQTATPVGTEELEQDSEVQWRLFSAGLVLTTAMLFGVYAIVVHEIHQSQPFRAIRHLVDKSPVLKARLPGEVDLRVVSWRYRLTQEGTAARFIVRAQSPGHEVMLGVDLSAGPRGWLIDKLTYQDSTGRLTDVREESKALAKECARIADSLRRNDDQAAALIYSDRAIEAEETCSEAHLVRAKVYEHMLRLEEALCDYGYTLELDPGNGGARWGRGHCQFMTGRYEEAVYTFNQLIDWQPQVASPYLYKAAALDSLGRDAEALVLYERYLELERDTSAFRYSVSEARQRIRELRAIKRK
jgi:uncharacterized RDD family membrane protein YckC